MITVDLAKTAKDLQGILTLQSENLKAKLSTAERHAEGFVTVIHDLDLLTQMNKPFPHTIAKYNDEVVAYALTMLKAIKNEVEVLKPMFVEIESCIENMEGLNADNYFVMGQICISKPHRAQGLFAKLYDHLCTRMAAVYDYIITEIAKQNKRSIRAHLKYGFKILKTYADTNSEWVIVILKIKTIT